MWDRTWGPHKGSVYSDTISYIECISCIVIHEKFVGKPGNLETVWQNQSAREDNLRFGILEFLLRIEDSTLVYQQQLLSTYVFPGIPNKLIFPISFMSLSLPNKFSLNNSILFIHKSTNLSDNLYVNQQKKL